MRIRLWPFVLAGFAGAIYTNDLLSGVWIGLALFVVLYFFSLNRRPFRTCGKCKGAGRHQGTIFLYAHRQCPECGGSGRHRRDGTAALWDGNQTWAEQQATAAGQRWNRPR